MRSVGIGVAGMLIMLLLSTCDYPEQGFYELSAVDGYGLPVASWPLMVEELTDDTHMTVAFNLLLPVEGELLELPLVNGEDLTRRYWTLTLCHADLGAGDLDLELTHADERLSFTGAYRVPPLAGAEPEHPAMATTDLPEEDRDERPGYGFGGYLPEAASNDTEIIVNGVLPPLPDELAGAVGFELRPITREQFEQALGTSVDGALRRLASWRESLTVSDAPANEIESQLEDLAEADGEMEEGAAQEGAGEQEAAEEDDDEARNEKQDQPPLGGRGKSS